MTEKNLIVTWGNSELRCPSCSEYIDLCETDVDWGSIETEEFFGKLKFSATCTCCGKLIEITSEPRVFELTVK